MVGNSKHEKQNPAKMREIDKEKEYLRGCLKVAEWRCSRSLKGSLTEKFWRNEIEKIKNKLGRL